MFRFMDLMTLLISYRNQYNILHNFIILLFNGLYISLENIFNFIW